MELRQVPANRSHTAVHNMLPNLGECKGEVINSLICR